jgi:hypothetical protein
MERLVFRKEIRYQLLGGICVRILTFELYKVD